jgi:hypothetical protein
MVTRVLRGNRCNTTNDMHGSIQARLDRQSRRALLLVTRRLGWSPSRAVREGLGLLATCHAGSINKKMVGVGKFASGVRDLGSNKKHLRGFGE